MKYVYPHTILGGTFDHFHTGHEKFISAALASSARITVGLVKKPRIAEKEHPRSIESYVRRESDLNSFFKKNKVSSRVSIIPLSDIYGTSLTDQSVEAIYVTESTHANALRINGERTKLGLPKLAIQVVDYVKGDDGLIVSSSRIRAGLIDRQGHAYLNYVLQKPIYHLPENMRQKLQTPLGTTTTNLDELASIFPPSATIISVGDIVSIDLIKSGYHPVICIIDHRTRRRNLDPKGITKYFPQSHHTLSNPPGAINAKIGELLLAALSSFQENKVTQVIAVEGEEDLLALPALLLAPLDSYVVYGQYNVGMCLVKVTEEIKYLAKNLLTEFA